jgi:hypothetical protein
VVKTPKARNPRMAAGVERATEEEIFIIFVFVFCACE